MIVNSLHDLRNWVIGFAESDWAVLLLALTSFSDAIFSPIPPDPLLIIMSLTNSGMAIYLALITTISSILGAIVGYWIGKLIGRPVLYRLFSERKITRVENMLQKYGVWATLIAAITPLPYKLFAITAGMLGVQLRLFILVSLIGRGIRFIFIAFMIMIYGKSIEIFISENLGMVSIIFTAIVIATGVLWVIIRSKITKSRDQV